VEQHEKSWVTVFKKKVVPVLYRTEKKSGAGESEKKGSHGPSWPRKKTGVRETLQIIGERGGPNEKQVSRGKERLRTKKSELFRKRTIDLTTVAVSKRREG